MLRIVTRSHIKSLNAINYIRIYACNNTLHQESTKLFSTSKLAKEVLDDSEALDPTLIESFPQQSWMNETDNVSCTMQIPIPAPAPIQSQLKHKLTPREIQDRQKKVWRSISNTLTGIWKNMDSIDKTNIKRIDKVYQKLSKLETLHVKNIQHSLHHIALLRDEVSTVNSRINYVFQRLSDLEKTAPSEWLEWSIPKTEIPFEESIYLRSPGYEIGSMIWCIELRWEIDENNNVEIEQEYNPIIDNKTNDNDNDNDNEYERINKGYNRLGVYVSPRSVANWERLSSLKATCEIRINENDYSDNINIITEHPPNKVNKKQQYFSVSGEFLRGKKLTSWGRTIPNGDDFFEKNKVDDEICIKLRILNQTLSYQQYVSENTSEKNIQITKPEYENFDFNDKKSKIYKQQKEDLINDKIQYYMNISINEFWDIFSKDVESAKSK
eukprot:179878_1